MSLLEWMTKIRTSSHHSICSFLANVNLHSHSLYAIAHPSVVCNVRAPYSGASNFCNIATALWTSAENFTEIVRGEPLHWGS